ncbi:MAG: hypothetical protein OEW83_18370 [Acidimicrobiia bacterium]|nr:hypothetical protein [Acidimicrobiia bacterium]
MRIPGSIIARIGLLAGGKALLISGTCFAVFAAVFFATSAPFAIPHVEELCGAAPLDVRFHSTVGDVEQFLDACGPDGRAAYRNLQIADLVYPIVFGLFMTSALAVTLKRLAPSHPDVVALAAIGLVGSGFDYLENAFAWRVLAAYPDVGTAGTLLGFASTAKTVSHWTAGVTLLAGLALLAGRAARHRMTSPHTGQPTPSLG